MSSRRPGIRCTAPCCDLLCNLRAHGPRCVRELIAAHLDEPEDEVLALTLMSESLPLLENKVFQFIWCLYSVGYLCGPVMGPPLIILRLFSVLLVQRAIQSVGHRSEGCFVSLLAPWGRNAGRGLRGSGPHPLPSATKAPLSRGLSPKAIS